MISGGDPRVRVRTVGKLLENKSTRVSYKKKQWRPPTKKKKRGKKPKPEEQEGMPQRQHCPPEKRRGDRSPQDHEDQQKDVA
jgi:hypothetical protein